VLGSPAPLNPAQQFYKVCGAGVIDSAFFLTQSVPSDLSLGQSYPIQITIVNSGTTAWRNSENYRLVSNYPYWSVNNVDLPNDVLPGQAVTFNFTISAPFTPGVYDFQWQMTRNGLPFNSPTPNVQIEVSSSDCSWDVEQACNWQGGYWNRVTCLCEGGY
jgi:hypothetical protein